MATEPTMSTIDTSRLMSDKCYVSPYSYSVEITRKALAGDETLE